MIIDCISDLHGSYPALDGGDLLIVAGDLTARDYLGELILFADWLERQDYKKKIVVAGNHDNLLQEKRIDFDPAEYLCDSGTEFEGLTIWGSPWTRYFEGMNPSCCAFTKNTEEELAEKWRLIPSGIDILVTHSPPAGILDQTERKYRVGSTALREQLLRIKPRLHVFGHIHEAHGQDREEWGNKDGSTTYVNAAHMNRDYKPVNKPIRIEL